MPKHFCIHTVLVSQVRKLMKWSSVIRFFQVPKEKALKWCKSKGAKVGKQLCVVVRLERLVFVSLEMVWLHKIWGGV
jgi:hypothetical protein